MPSSLSDLSFEVTSPFTLRVNVYLRNFDREMIQWPGNMKGRMMYFVNIAELKKNLIRYLQQVKAGKEIIIIDRDIPVARLVPMNVTEELDDELLMLSAQGKIRLGQGPIGEDYWGLKIPRVKTCAIKSENALQWLIDRERNR